MSKYTVSEYDGYALIVKDGRDMNSEEVADELNYLDKERANRDKTLSDIAQALGLEKGDVDGIGAAIDLLQMTLSAEADGLTECSLKLRRARVAMTAAKETAGWDQVPHSLHEKLDELFKALAAGEAGNYPPCKCCGGPNDTGELCLKCAQGNDPFQHCRRD